MARAEPMVILYNPKLLPIWLIPRRGLAGGSRSLWNCRFWIWQPDEQYVTQFSEVPRYLGIILKLASLEILANKALLGVSKIYSGSNSQVTFETFT